LDIFTELYTTRSNNDSVMKTGQLVNVCKSSLVWFILMKVGCRKGKRDCVYPEPKSKSKRKKKQSNESPLLDEHDNQEGNESSADSLEHLDEEEPCSAISEEPRSSLDFRKERTVSEATNLSDSPTLVDIESSQKLYRADSTTIHPISLSGGVADLPEDLKLLLQYARENITHWHYNMIVDGPNFVEMSIFQNALIYEPLLYALCCFAAYHKSIRAPDGEIKDFLKYHSRSIRSLQDSIKTMKKHNFLTLITILQLATIEVCENAVVRIP
jgi:hypothetical protein